MIKDLRKENQSLATYSLDLKSVQPCIAKKNQLFLFIEIDRIDQNKNEYRLKDTFGKWIKNSRLETTTDKNEAWVIPNQQILKDFVAELNKPVDDTPSLFDLASQSHQENEGKKECEEGKSVFFELVTSETPLTHTQQELEQNQTGHLLVTSCPLDTENWSLKVGSCWAKVETEFLVSGIDPEVTRAVVSVTDKGWVGKNTTLDGSDNPIYPTKLFKPRVNADGKTIKYEYPSGSITKDTHYYLLPKIDDSVVLNRLITKIIEKHDLKLSAADFDSYASFFEAAKELMPVSFTEGFKKTLKLICEGELAFGFTSVTTWGYKDKNDNSLVDKDGFKRLNPTIKELIEGAKEIVNYFDCDEKPSTKKAVDNQCEKLALAIHNELGLSVSRKLWNGVSGKGIDDYLANGNHLENTVPVHYDFPAIKKRLLTEIEAKKEKEFPWLEQACDDLFKGRWLNLNGEFYQYNGRFYELVNNAMITRKIKNWCSNYTDSKGIKSKANPTSVENVRKWATAGFIVDPSEVNPEGHFPLKNGILTRVGEGGDTKFVLNPHTPDTYFTFCSEVEYRPEVDAIAAERLLECLDEPYRSLMLKTLSCMLDVPLIRKKIGRIKALICVGDGNNGKDTLREVMSMILGQTGMTSCTLTDFKLSDGGRAFNLARLATNPKLNWSSENKYLTLDSIQSLKQAISGDSLYIEAKGKDGYDIRPKSVFLFNANKAPKIEGNQSAIYSRFSVIPFEKTYSVDPKHGELLADTRYKEDPDFLIKEVCPAFLNLLITAFKEVAVHGLKTSYSESNSFFKEVMLESNHLKRFCEDLGLVFTGNNKDVVHCGELYKQLLTWYIDNDYLKFDDRHKEIWSEQEKDDPLVKGSNQVRSRFQSLFPKSEVKRLDGKTKLTGLTFLDLDSPKPETEKISDQEVTSKWAISDQEVTNKWAISDQEVTNKWATGKPQNTDSEKDTTDNEVTSLKKVGNEKSEENLSLKFPSEPEVIDFLSNSPDQNHVLDIAAHFLKKPLRQVSVPECKAFSVHLEQVAARGGKLVEGCGRFSVFTEKSEENLSEDVPLEVEIVDPLLTHTDQKGEEKREKNELVTSEIGVTQTQPETEPVLTAHFLPTSTSLLGHFEEKVVTSRGREYQPCLDYLENGELVEIGDEIHFKRNEQSKQEVGTILGFLNGKYGMFCDVETRNKEKLSLKKEQVICRR